MTSKISHLITIYAELDTYPVAMLARNFRKSCNFFVKSSLISFFKNYEDHILPTK